MARPVPRASRCPHCNAPFTPQVAKTHYVCGYCGHAFDLDGPPPLQPGPRAPRPAPPGRQATIIVVGAATVFMLTTAAMAMAFLSGPTKDLLSPPRPPATASRPVIPGAPPEPPSPKRGPFQWVEQGAPVFADVNGDGTEDIIGHVSQHEEGTGFRNVIAAFDGRTFQKLWESAPAEGPDTSRYVKVIAQNGRLVMSEQRKLNLLELATGKRLGHVPLTDSPRRLCIPPGDTTSVWVEVADRKHLLFDTRTATAEPAPQAPKGCATPPQSMKSCDITRPLEHPTSCERSSDPPSDIRGFSARYLLRTGGYTLALGMRYPGTSVPMVALFEPGNRKPLWHDIVSDKDPLLMRDFSPEVGEITKDAVYVIYVLEKGGKQLIRRDLNTGAVVWDVALPEAQTTAVQATLWARDGRIYVSEWGSLHALDAATGERVGGIGVK